MKINLLNEPMNRDPERVIEVTKQKFFEYFFSMILLKNRKTLSDNEIKVLSHLCADKELSETGISKSNLPPVIKKLNEKGFMVENELSEVTKIYKKVLKKDVEIVFNFKIVDDDNRSDNRDGA